MFFPDDDWFHRTRAFAELSLQFTVHIRDQLPRDNGLRPGFLGHILVELLLDAVLIEEDSGLLDAYYDAVGQVDPHVVGRAVNRMSTKTTDDLPRFIQLFIRERFLYDYAEDAKLVYRLNQVLRRVKLAALPGRDELLAKVAASFRAPLDTFARTLSEVPSMFVCTLVAVRDQQEAA